MFKYMISSVALCAAAASSYAAGPLDGIYQWKDGAVFYSVHQTGDSIIVGRFRSEAGSNLVNQAPGVVAMRPARFDTYNLYSGTLGAAQATTSSGLPATSRSGVIVGEGAFGACTVNLVITFTTITGGATSGQVQIVSSVPTSYGFTAYANDPALPTTSSALNCSVSLGQELGLAANRVQVEPLVKLR